MPSRLESQNILKFLARTETKAKIQQAEITPPKRVIELVEENNRLKLRIGVLEEENRNLKEQVTKKNLTSLSPVKEAEIKEEDSTFIRFSLLELT